MKKLYQLLGCALILFSLASFALADWVTCALDDQVTVQTPVPMAEIDLVKQATAAGYPPEQIAKLRDAKMKFFSAKDAAGTYLVTRIDRTGDGAENRDAASRSAYYAGVISGMLNNEKGVLLEQVPFGTLGGEGIEFKYKGVHRGTGKMVIKYNRALLVGPICYNLSFISQDRQDSTGTSGSAQRRQFFESLAVKSNPASVPKPAARH